MNHEFVIKLLAIWMGLLIAACSPGTGGTGTGPAISNTALPVGASLTYNNIASTTTSVTSTTTAAPTVVCGNPVAQVNLLLQPQSIVVTTHCATFTYAGSWVIDATGTVSVQGQWQTLQDSPGSQPIPPQAAILSLQFSSSGIDSPALTLAIKDIAGVELLGQQTLQRGVFTPG